MKKSLLSALMLLLWSASMVASSPNEEISSIIDIINKVNTTWQQTHQNPGNAFWDNAAYHTGNMAAYNLTKNPAFLNYSLNWADQNQWMGAKSQNPSEWKYATYGEGDDYVMFGDWQVCFQTYADLYKLENDPNRIKRAKEVLEYQMSTPNNDYWWWADGLYMVMPLMTKMYTITGDTKYLDKLYEYWTFADDLMYDKDAHLYYRDGKYIYPKHKSANGLKDFWARGDGWVVAALAKVITDMPDNRPEKAQYIQRYLEMAKAVADSQQPEGYWTRSILDPEHAPGPETSGTAFFTYGLLWGLNNGLLEEEVYGPVVEKAWDYLVNTALQEDGTVGYVQPIGERAIPGQVVDRRSTSNFGTGAFLLAATEMVRRLEDKSDDDEAYLFTYFTGNSGDEEAIRFAIGDKNLKFHTLNANKPVIDSKKISETGGVRDPHILRGPDGNFYMVVTDMVSDRGWDSNRGLVLLKSPDLINWKSSKINIQKRYKGNKDLKRVWAPQTIYDPKAGKYMVYFSMQHGDGPDIIYYVYTNDDFTDFVGEPQVLFTPQDGLACIDGDIVYHNGRYYLFYKTEGHGNKIKLATTHDLTSGKWVEFPDYKQQTENAVEGAGVFPLIKCCADAPDKFILMYDVYMKGAYEFTESDDLQNFNVINGVEMDFHPRHGTIIPITGKERKRLIDKWGLGTQKKQNNKKK